MVLIVIIIAIIIANVGSGIISMGFRRLRAVSSQDSAGVIANNLPNRVGGMFYWKGDSQKLFLFVVNSKNWPDDKNVRQQLKSIRLICVFGTLISLAGFIVAAVALLSAFKPGLH